MELGFKLFELSLALFGVVVDSQTSKPTPELLERANRLTAKRKSRRPSTSTPNETSCSHCNAVFSVWNAQWRYRCCQCGCQVCAACTTYKTIEELSYHKEVVVCVGCKEKDVDISDEERAEAAECKRLAREWMEGRILPGNQ